MLCFSKTEIPKQINVTVSAEPKTNIPLLPIITTIIYGEIMEQHSHWIFAFSLLFDHVIVRHTYDNTAQ